MLAVVTLLVLLLGALPGRASATSTGTAGTTLFVTTSGTDVGNTTCARLTPCASVAHALSLAVNGDTIAIGPGTFAGGVTLAINVTLVGAGADETVLTGPGQSAVVTVDPTVSVGIDDLAIQPSFSEAGIVTAAATVRVVAVSIAAVGSAGMSDGIVVSSGDGTAQLSVVDSTLSGAVPANGAGDGIVVAAHASDLPNTVTIVNSTLADNTNDGFQDIGADVVNLDSDTIVDNGTTGIDAPLSSATLVDTLLAENRSDCVIGQITSASNNLLDVDNALAGSPCAELANVDGNLVGTAANPLNAAIGALASNGGPTATVALEPGSPAIGAGNAADCATAPVDNLDQRGDPRNAISRGTCDIGAYDTGGSLTVVPCTSVSLTAAPVLAAVGTNVALMATASGCPSAVFTFRLQPLVAGATASTIATATDGQAIWATVGLSPAFYELEVTAHAPGQVGSVTSTPKVIVLDPAYVGTAT